MRRSQRAGRVATAAVIERVELSHHQAALQVLARQDHGYSFRNTKNFRYLPSGNDSSAGWSGGWRFSSSSTRSVWVFADASRIAPTNSSGETRAEQEAVARMPPWASTPSAARGSDAYPSSAAGTAFCDLAKAGGTRTSRSNRLPAESRRHSSTP